MSGLNGLWKLYVSEVTMTLDEYKLLLWLENASSHYPDRWFAGIKVLDRLLEKHHAELGLPQQYTIAEALGEYNALSTVVELELSTLTEEDQFTYIMTAGYPE